MSALGRWCVSLTSPSMRLDRMTLATPIQGCRGSPLAPHIASLPAPPTALPRICLPIAPLLFGLRTVTEHAPLSRGAAFRDALPPRALEGQGGMAALSLTGMAR